MITTQTTLTTSTVAFVAVAALFLFGASTAHAASEYAASVEAFVQGTQKGGGAVAPARSDASDALGAPDSSFVSLGYGGEIWLGFSQNMSGNLMLAVQETTGGSYPLETADVYVSTEAAGPWTLVGQASNEEGEGDGITELSVEECFQYVRIVDTTDDSLHSNSSDGFDVDAVEATYDETCPEPKPKKKRTNIRVSNHNLAVVDNTTTAHANTGGNYAGGSNGGDGGNGGDIENEGDRRQDVERSDTGNGGNGGTSGAGGMVQSGRALAEAGTVNVVNTNVTRLNGCECNGTGHVRVRNYNHAFLSNTTLAGANTGLNKARGSNGGDGGAGGEIENEGDERQGNGAQEVDQSTTGNGGHGGGSSIGGTVVTGAATARSRTENAVNTNRLRLR